MSLLIDPYRFAAAGDTFIMGYRQDVMAWSSVDGSSGITYTRGQSSSALSGGLAGVAAAADADNSDYMEWQVNLAAGTYTLTGVFFRSTDRGIADWSLDGVSVGTYDMYGVAGWNIVSEITGITVAADGNYTLRVTANGKNASSSDYVINHTSVTMTRTGA